MRKAFPLLLLAALPAGALAQSDSDRDGVIDSVDAFPCDAASAGEAWAPARGTFGMLMLEDSFPAGADYDFNDVVVGYNFMARTDAAGRVVALRANLQVLANGGAIRSGLGLHLPVPASSVASVTRTLGTGSPQALTPRSDSELTVTVLDDVRQVLGATAGPINSIPTLARIDGTSIQIDVVLSTPTAIPMAQAPFDLFAFHVLEPSREIHLPRYRGTAAMNRYLFGTQDDASVEGRWFVDRSGIPFALTMPTLVPYPLEALEISDLFPDILGFAASGGATHQSFYAANVMASAAYQDNQGRGRATPALSVDRFPTSDACVPRYFPGTQSFAYTGGSQTFVVPQAVTSLQIVARGAAGGTVDSIRLGGAGGRISATIPVTPGETLYIYVGGMGGRPGGGWNGGGAAGSGATFLGGGGGGATDVRRGTALNTRILVAGGAGGGGVGPGSRQNGGAGGGLNAASGQSSSSSQPGGGGTQTYGGAGGTSGYNGQLGPYPGSAGGLGYGGNGGAFPGSTPRGGGAGGGYYGGGGGGVYYCCGAGGAGGGGGSSYAAPTATNVVHTPGHNGGNGDLTLTW